MSSIGKLRKNAENYRVNELYRNMTPEQYKEGIRRAVDIATKELASRCQRDIERVEEEANKKIEEAFRFAIDTISVELLYELGRQLGCFEENAEYLDQKIDRVQEIYKNTMKAIEKYTNYKKIGKARKEFEAKKKKLEKMFNIEF